MLDTSTTLERAETAEIPDSVALAESDRRLSKNRALTPQQIAWVDQFVSNGRNGFQAARAAGYAESCAHTVGNRLLKDPRIVEAIRVRSGETVVERMPALIEAMVCMVLEGKDTATARVSAFKELRDLAGLGPKSGPLVQVNVGTDPKALAQELIDELWSRRSARTGLKPARMSDNAGGMSDIERPRINHATPPPPVDLRPEGWGGSALQGPVTSACPIPPGSTADDPDFAWPSGTEAEEGIIEAEWRERSAPAADAGAVGAWRAACRKRGGGDAERP